MWSDGASKIDMLAYQPYSDLIFEIAISKRLNPLTIGLFGSWGSGKSTLLDLIDNRIQNYKGDTKVISIKVNAWVYEGYDDAKAALMDAVLKAIIENSTIPEKCKEGFFSLIKKVDWLRIGTAIAKKGLPIAASVLTGNPLPALINLLPNIKDMDIQEIFKEENLEKLSSLKEYIKKENEDEQKSIFENIRTFRNEFEEQLEKSSIDNLIIIVDDLDRCSPDRIIDTLEAIKLFLSVNKTTFIVAVDEKVINYSIKRKYPSLENTHNVDISKDYIEKIIQLPITLPELSEIDIKNYMLLLISEMFLKEDILLNIIGKFKKDKIFAKGEIISTSDIISTIGGNDHAYKESQTDKQFINFLDIFNKIGDIVAGTLKGNPRQTKRFLNTFFIRKRLAEIQEISLDAGILAKLMVLEYTNKELFKQLYNWQCNNGGLAAELKNIEEVAIEEKDTSDVVGYNSQWFDTNIKNWLRLEPTKLYEVDLRQYFYLARESVGERIVSILNLRAELRKLITDISTDGLDEKILCKKLESLKELNPNDRNTVIFSVIDKFNQGQEKFKNKLLEIMRIYPEYSENVTNEFKKLKDIKKDPGFYLKLNNFDEPQRSWILKLQQYFIDNNLITKEFIETIEKMSKRGKK